MNKDEFYSEIEDVEKFKEELRLLVIKQLGEYGNFLFNSVSYKHNDGFGEPRLPSVEFLKKALDLYQKLLDYSIKGFMTTLINNKKFQVENK